MFTGLHIVNREVLDYIPLDRPSSITNAYITMLRQDIMLNAYITKDYWNDLGHIDRYTSVDRALKEGQLRLNHI